MVTEAKKVQDQKSTLNNSVSFIYNGQAVFQDALSIVKVSKMSI